MKKFLSMFAFLLCATLAFTSCSPEEEENAGNGGGNTAGNGGGNTEWVAGLDESGAPDRLVLRYEEEGVKMTVVAEFKDGKCVKYTTTVEVAGYEEVIDSTADFEGMDYEFIKYAFNEMAGMDDEVGDDENEDPVLDWSAGLDESGAPDELVVRYEIDGTKATIVAEFEDGACVKATMIVEVYGYETSTDMTSTYKGYNYEFVKATFEALVNSAE